MGCNDDPPSIAKVAKVRQHAISKGDYTIASIAADELPEIQKAALKKLEDMNKSVIQDQLANVLKRKTQIYEMNKRILLDTEARIARNLLVMRQQRLQKLLNQRKMAQLSSMIMFD